MNCIATLLLLVYNIHSYCVRLRCAFVINLCHTHTNVLVGLPITGSEYICVNVALVLTFYMLNDIG